MQLPMLAANSSWFTFSMEGLDGLFDNPAVYAFSGKEEANKPFVFCVELVSRSSNLDLSRMLGRSALLTITDRSGGRRFVHGIVRETEQLHTANRFTHYRCFLVPRLWFLGETQEQRIYQHRNVLDIIDSVLRRHMFADGTYAFKMREKYQEREYCVQYGESDLHFLDRLCEEEGIVYFFEHTVSNHCLVFTDAESGPGIPGESPIRFYPGSGNLADTAVISRLNLRQRINSNRATYREWNFTRPQLDLEASRNEPEFEKAPLPPGMSLETYLHPHLYQLQAEGDRYAKIRPYPQRGPYRRHRAAACLRDKQQEHPRHGHRADPSLCAHSGHEARGRER
jgi:type VI secretion system secreted protein VgrG